MAASRRYVHLLTSRIDAVMLSRQVAIDDKRVACRSFRASVDDVTAVRHFAAYTYGPAFAANISPFGLATDAGIGVGSTVAQLRAAYPAAIVMPEDEFTGPNFEIEAGLRGVLTGTDDSDVILSFVGGFGCGE